MTVKIKIADTKIIAPGTDVYVPSFCMDGTVVTDDGSGLYMRSIFRPTDDVRTYVPVRGHCSTQVWYVPLHEIVWK